jgi:hypothetical protein
VVSKLVKQGQAAGAEGLKLLVIKVMLHAKSD